MKTTQIFKIYAVFFFTLSLCSWVFYVLTTLARKVPVMKISISMVRTSWMMRRMMAAGHSSVMQRKP